MTAQKPAFLPIIVGTDMNAYNMAISFHEAYRIKPVLVGKEPLSFTSLSTIPYKIELDSALSDENKFTDILINVANTYKTDGRELLLVGTNDLYVRLIIENAERLKEHFTFNYIDRELMDHLQIKSHFYKLCKEHGIETPITFFYNCRVDGPFTEDISYPVIVKPSDTVVYNQHKFAGQQKVYKVNSLAELNDVIETVKKSGYNEELIIQDYIPGDDTYMWDSVIYSNTAGQTQLVTFAQVVLQEHTVTAIGNYTALVTRFDEEMMYKLKNFLEAVGYTGFANFDLKYDSRDGKFKVFEVNIRQGRSSYYTTALGHNMASYLVDDLIYQKPKPLVLLDKPFLFTVVPKIVLKKFVTNKTVKKDIKRLLKHKKYGNPLFYKGDKSLKRKLYLFLRQVNYYKKYKNNTW